MASRTKKSDGGRDISHIFLTPTLWLPSVAQSTDQFVSWSLFVLHHNKYSSSLTWPVNGDNRGFSVLVVACATGDITGTKGQAGYS